MSAKETVELWATQVRAKGGVPVRTGFPFDPNKGKPCARYPDAKQSIGWRYELAPAAVIAAVASIRADEFDAIAVGKAVQEIEDKTGINNGLLGIIAKGLGIPYWLLVTGLVGAAGVVAYGAGVQAGILPPLNKLMRGGADR